MNTNNELLNAIKSLLSYRAHRKECAIDQTDFCTCGMKQEADHARELIRKHEAN